MKKSVYSLVLMDDVVRAVDAQAGRLGTSRSNLINQILAEHLSCVTPEMRMKAIFGQVQRLIDTTFQVQQQSPSAMTFRGSLQYKYHPTISYRVELNRVPERFLGKLSVSIRTQNQKLIRECTEFFRYRCEMEARELARLGFTDYTAGIGAGTSTRIRTGEVAGSKESGKPAGQATIESGELALDDSFGKVLPLSIYVRLSRDM